MELREQLQEIEHRLLGLRQERAQLNTLFEGAKASAAEHETEASLGTAVAAKESLTRIDAQIESLRDDQTNLLRRLGDAEAGRVGGALPGSISNGWREAARRLDIGRGEVRVDLPGTSLIRAAVDFTPGASTAPVVQAPLATPAVDPRFLYPNLVQSGISTGDGLAVGGFTVSFAEPAVTGDIERDPVSTSTKAELGADVSWNSEDLRQFAIIASSIPGKVIEVEPRLRGFLETRMRFELDKTIDEHCITAIEGSNPPSGLTGADLIAQARNGITEARANGANPTILAVDPDDAASLDLDTRGADDAYTFAVRATGGASPLWNLRVQEVPGISNPTLIDPVLLGILYIGGGRITVDPYGDGLRHNTVDIRVELEALYFVQDPAGAYVISS